MKINTPESHRFRVRLGQAASAEPTLIIFLKRGWWSFITTLSEERKPSSGQKRRPPRHRQESQKYQRTRNMPVVPMTLHTTQILPLRQNPSSKKTANFSHPLRGNARKSRSRTVSHPPCYNPRSLLCWLAHRPLPLLVTTMIGGCMFRSLRRCYQLASRLFQEERLRLLDNHNMLSLNDTRALSDSWLWWALYTATTN